MSSDTTTVQDLTPRTWASDRLRLGQTNVGFWVLTAIGVLTLRPELDRSSLGADLLTWAGLVLAYVALQLPFDAVGGYLLPVRYGRREPGWGSWLGEWAVGAALHAATVGACGASALWIGAHFGAWVAAAVLVAASAALVAAQGPLAAAYLGRRPLSPDETRADTAFTRAGVARDRIDVVDAPDVGFVGGWVGLPGAERLVLPARWLRLPESALEVVALRRALALRSGARARGVALALAFNALGLVIVLSLLPGAGLGSPSQLLLTNAGFTLWSFLGLLTLPTASRAAVVALDRGAADTLGAVDPVIRTIALLDRDQEGEADRGAWTEAVFHPVPSPAARGRALATGRPTGPGAWRVARTALFTGWAYGSWLSRAVHCNSGRPSLWVLFPGD